jgi:hypothetical protein
MTRPNAEDRRVKDRIVAQLAASDFALPGTILERRICCKKPGCRCMREPPELHGPYYQWTRKLNGKTVTRLLTSEQKQRYEAWFENAKQIRSLLAELEALSLVVLESVEGSSTSSRAFTDKNARDRARRHDAPPVVRRDRGGSPPST